MVLLVRTYNAHRAKEYIMTKSTVITHAAPSHADEVLAIALLSLWNTPSDFQVDRVTRPNMDATIAASPDATIVDVGGVYDPSNGRFDHHQDQELNSSMVLVGEHTGTPLTGRLAEYLNIKDLKGWEVANKAVGYTVEEGDRVTSQMAGITGLLDYIAPEGVVPPGFYRVIGDCLYKAGYHLTVEVMQEINESLTAEYPTERRETVKAAEDLVAAKKIAITAIEVVNTPVGRIGICHDRGVHVPQAESGLNTVVAYNTRNHQVNIITDTEVLTVNDVLKVLGNPPTTFIHNSGFIAALNLPWEDMVKLVKEAAV